MVGVTSGAAVGIAGGISGAAGGGVKAIAYIASKGLWKSVGIPGGIIAVAIG